MSRPWCMLILFFIAAFVQGQPSDPATTVATIEPAHFHHVHLNVTDPEATMKFYERVLGAVRTKYRGAADALFTERSFILMNKVDAPPPSSLVSGIWHIGWGGVDVLAEYNWWKDRDVTFHTPPRPLSGENNHYMYISGPDHELIEINTMGHHRFAHVHLFATDVNEVTNWYTDHLGLASARGRNAPKPTNMIAARGIWSNFIKCDNVVIIIFGKPESDPPPPWWPDAPLRAIEPTRGRPIDHIAFSYREIEPVFERMKSAGVEIVEPMTSREEYGGMKSFFVMGPEKVLIEIVEEKPVPEGIWE